MKAVDYKRTILKEMCRKYNIEYDEEQMNSWFYYRVSLADTQRNWKIYLVDTLLVKENLEEYIAEQLLGPLARSGIHLKEKDFFEEYVDKFTFRHCTKGDKFRGLKYKDEIVVFIKNEITTFGISKEELEGFVDLTRLTNFFGIDFKVKESEKYEYVTTTNSIYKTTGGDKSLMETGEYDNGMLFFDSKTKKYILMQGDVFCPLDANYISFTIGNGKFIPVVDIRYFIKLYTSLLKKKIDKEAIFAVEDTKENLKKIKKLIIRKSDAFAICDYKENHFYVKCLSGEDDELLFRLHF